ncbi:MAG: DUF2752 domain-containing protein [Bacteroidales bacterium]
MKRVAAKKRINGALIIVLLFSLLLLYKFYNPLLYNLFPNCFFKEITGFKCPGCGAQSAIHSLLNFNLYGALQHNPLFVTALPYIVMGILLDNLKPLSARAQKLRRVLYGKFAITTLALIVAAFWIVRNL